MSGLDDTTEPADPEAGQAQNQDDTAMNAAPLEEQQPLVESGEEPDTRRTVEDAPEQPVTGAEAADEEPAEPPVEAEPPVAAETPAEAEPPVAADTPVEAEPPTEAPDGVAAASADAALSPEAPVGVAAPSAEAGSAPGVDSSAEPDSPATTPTPAAPAGTETTTPAAPAGTETPAAGTETPTPGTEPQPAAAPPVTQPASEGDSKPAVAGKPRARETKTSPPPGAPQGSPTIGATAVSRTVTPPPTGGPRPKPVTETGKLVEGIVTAVSAESVELTLDDGRPAVIHRRNFGLHDEDPSTVLSVGDKAFGAELAREDPKSRVVLSRAWALKRKAWERVVRAAADNQLLSGKVISASKKGLVVDVGVRGFVPSSHLELTAVTDMSPYVGETMELKILEVDPRREKLVLSRRSLLLKAQRKEMQELLSSLKPGEVRSGIVASIADYGVFVDLGGVSGLVHISELSWRRVSRPSEVVSVGDRIDVKVLDVKPKKKRISLSMRQITDDPLAAIEVGAVVTGPVTRLVDFGAFVAIGEFEGLVHLSELAEYRVSTPEEIVAPGDEVGVKILSVDLKRRRIELSIRRAAEYGG